MGFLQFIPASRLSAIYTNGRLGLSATGDAQQFTSGIEFVPDTQFAGGLKYNLMGWVGPLTGKSQPYQQQQSFEVAGVPKQVVVQDASGSHVVKVELVPDGTKAATTPAAAGAQQQLTVPLNEPFQIPANASVPSAGSVTVAFDDAFLAMKTASIQNKGGEQIVWTFDPIKIGRTKVTITTSGGIATFIMQRVIDIEIVLP
jgi:hypothetical protein